MYAQPGQNITFSFEYVISIIIILAVCHLLIKSNPQMNTIVVVIAGLLVGYVSLAILNTISGHRAIDASDFSSVLRVVVDKHVLGDARHGGGLQVHARGHGDLQQNV